MNYTVKDLVYWAGLMSGWIGVHLALTRLGVENGILLLICGLTAGVGTGIASEVLFLRGREQRTQAEVAVEAAAETEPEEFEYADELPDLGEDR